MPSVVFLIALFYFSFFPLSFAKECPLLYHNLHLEISFLSSMSLTSSVMMFKFAEFSIESNLLLKISRSCPRFVLHPFAETMPALFEYSDASSESLCINLLNWHSYNSGVEKIAAYINVLSSKKTFLEFFSTDCNSKFTFMSQFPEKQTIVESSGQFSRKIFSCPRFESSSEISEGAFWKQYFFSEDVRKIKSETLYGNSNGFEKIRNFLPSATLSEKIYLFSKPTLTSVSLHLLKLFCDNFKVCFPNSPSVAQLL